MIRERVLVTNFAAGQVTEGYAGRVDAGVYRTAAAELRGMVLRPDGGVQRRPASVYVHHSAGISPHSDGIIGKDAIPAIVLFDEQDGTKREPRLAFIDDSNDLHILNLATGSEETLAVSLNPGSTIYTTGTFAAEDAIDTQHIQLWNSSGAELINLETREAFPRTGREIATVFENRLIAADRAFGRIYFSEPLNLLNFDLEREEEVEDTDGNTETVMVPTGAIRVRADFYGVERILWIAGKQTLYLGTDRGEYEVASNYPSFNSEIGGVMILPISYVGSPHAYDFGSSLVLIKDRRLVRMDWTQNGGYQSSSMMELLDNSEVIQLASIDLGSHRYLFALDINSDLWCFTEAPGQEVAGWTRFATDVWAIASYDQDLYVVFNRSGSFSIEVIGIDTLHFGGDREPIEHRAYADMPLAGDKGMYVYLGDDVLKQYPGPADTEMECWVYHAGEYTAIDDRTTDENGELYGDYLTARNHAGVSHPSQAVVFARPKAGLYAESYIRTMPIEIATDLGSGLGQPGRITSVVVFVERSEAMEVRVAGGQWQAWESDEPFTGPVKFTVQSSNQIQTYVEIRSVADHPLTVMTIQADVTKGST